MNDVEPTTSPPLEPGARAVPARAPAPSRTRVALLAGGAASVVGGGLSMLGLVLIEPERALQTAVPLGVTAIAVELATAAGGVRGGRVGTAMASGLAALLAVGFPLFVALEPVWWRFGAGMAAPIIVAAALAYGAPEALEPGHLTAKDAAKAWLGAPLRLLRAVGLALLGREDASTSR